MKTVQRPFSTHALLAAASLLHTIGLLAQGTIDPPASLHTLVFGRAAQPHLLVAALSQLEKERGITINTTHVEYKTCDRPRLTPLIEEVLTSGLTFDAAIIPAAPLPPTPTPNLSLDDTLALCRLLDIPHVFLTTPTATLTPDHLAHLQRALALQGYAEDRTSIIPLRDPIRPGQPDQGLLDLFRQLHHLKPTPAALDRPFLMPIEDVIPFARSSPASLLARGHIERGIIKSGETVDIIGFHAEPQKATVTGIEMFRKILDRGEAGDNVGLLLRGIEKKDIRRGMVIAKPGTTSAHSRFVGEFTSFPLEEDTGPVPSTTRQTTVVLLRTAEVPAEVLLLDDPTGASQPTAALAVNLIAPIAMEKGLRFAIRQGGRIVGLGQVVEILK